MPDPAPATTFNVTTTDELWTALHAAHSGDTVLLAPGNYARLALAGLHFDGQVTVTSAIPTNEAVLNGIALTNDSGLIFDHLDVIAGAAGAGVGVSTSGGSNLSFTNLRVHGDTPGQNGVGFMIRASSNVTVSGSELTNLGSGVGHNLASGLNVVYNSFHDLGTDGVFGGGSSQVLVSGNTFTNFHPAAGVHPDAIQFYASNGTHSSNVTIANNTITRGSGDPIQGIFIEATDNLTIAHNALSGTMTNGISIVRSSTVDINDNFLQGFLDLGTRIIVRGTSANVTVEYNVTQEIQNYKDAGQPNPGYVQHDNTIIAGAASTDGSALLAWQQSHASSPVIYAPYVVTPPNVDFLQVPPVDMSHLLIDLNPSSLTSFLSGWAL